MAEDRDARYWSLMVRHLAMNRQTWQVLVEQGLTPAADVRLDFATSGSSGW